MIIPVAFADGSQKLMRYKKEGEDTFAVRDIVPVRFVPLLPNVVARNAYQPQDLQEVAF